MKNYLATISFIFSLLISVLGGVGLVIVIGSPLSYTFLLIGISMIFIGGISSMVIYKKFIYNK